MPGRALPDAERTAFRALLPLPVVVGTLDDPDRLPPDIHIYVSSKQPWVLLPKGAPAMPGYYDLNAWWPARSLERRAAVWARAKG